MMSGGEAMSQEGKRIVEADIDSWKGQGIQLWHTVLPAETEHDNTFAGFWDRVTWVAEVTVNYNYFAGGNSCWSQVQYTAYGKTPELALTKLRSKVELGSAGWSGRGKALRSWIGGSNVERERVLLGVEVPSEERPARSRDGGIHNWVEQQWQALEDTGAADYRPTLAEPKPVMLVYDYDKERLQHVLLEGKRHPWEEANDRKTD